MEFEELSQKAIGCAIEVHRHLGPGLLESAYQQCLAYELSKNGISFELEFPLSVRYKEVSLDCGYRMDFFIEKELVLEIKSISELTGIHTAQILTYMKLARAPIGLLINFNVLLLKDGIKRFVL